MQALAQSAPERATQESSSKRPVWSWTDAVAQAAVPPLTKLVCLNIARYLSSAGKGWRIPIKQMMADTGISNRSLATHLENAEMAGLLVIQRMPGPNGQRGVTLYKPRFPADVELSREPAEMPGEEGSPGPREGGSLRPGEGGSRQEAFQNNLSKKPPTPKGGCEREAFDLWNDLAKRLGLPRASQLTNERKRKLLARLADYGLDGWKHALANVERSKFLRGLESGRKWRCTFDFMISPSGFPKVHDGAYGDVGGATAGECISADGTQVLPDGRLLIYRSRNRPAFDAHIAWAIKAGRQQVAEAWAKTGAAEGTSLFPPGHAINGEAA